MNYPYEKTHWLCDLCEKWLLNRLHYWNFQLESSKILGSRLLLFNVNLSTYSRINTICILTLMFLVTKQKRSPIYFEISYTYWILILIWFDSSLKYSERTLPAQLVEYLDTSNCCVNPRCRGVYFDSRVEHVKFVDFCGKYRIPLMQYICSSRCRTGLDWTDDSNVEDSTRMQRVLLG